MWLAWLIIIPARLITMRSKPIYFKVVVVAVVIVQIVVVFLIVVAVHYGFSCGQ